MLDVLSIVLQNRIEKYQIFLATNVDVILKIQTQHTQVAKW